METKNNYQKPFGLKTFFVDGKEQVCVFEEKLVPSVYAPFEAKQCILDYGESAEMVDNYIAVKKADGQFQLFCYADGKLNQGPVCEQYINSETGFIYKDFRDTWYRSLHNCSGAMVLGRYEAGIWLEQGKNSVWVSYLTEKGWRRRKYCSVREWKDRLNFFAFQKSNGNFDLIVVFFSGTARRYLNLTEKEINQQAEGFDIYPLPEAQEEFKVVECNQIHGKR